MISRRLCLSILSTPKFSRSQHLSLAHSFCSSISFDSSVDSSSRESFEEPRVLYDRPLEDGVDIGIYKAILVGKVGQYPLQKELKSGTKVTLFSLGTGGIRNNRRPLDNEDPMEYANRRAVQWHRVSVYPERLGRIVMKNVVRG